MNFLNRILVPVDLSPCSAAALEYAAFIGAHSGAHISVVHVMEQAHDADHSVEDIYSPRRQALHKRLEGLVGEALSHSAADVEVDVRYGDPAENILAAAKEAHADMIVMGKYGERALDPSHPGNVIEAVSHGADVAVVPVHEAVLDGFTFCLSPPKASEAVANERMHRAGERERRQRSTDLNAPLGEQAGRKRRGEQKGPRIPHH